LDSLMALHIECWEYVLATINQNSILKFR